MRNTRASSSTACAVDDALAVERVMRLMAIPGLSGDEGAVQTEITAQLVAAGVEASWICRDAAHRRSPRGGRVGNLIVKLPGAGSLRRAPRRMLMAHADTVPLCVGSQPRRTGAWVRSADPDTGLGADDRAGCAVVLTAAVELLTRGGDRPPLSLLWTVQEEAGLLGARGVAASLLGKPAAGFNFDGGSPAKLTIGATGAERLTITIRGVAAHAGIAPRNGVSAIVIASRAVAALHADGWLGAVEKGRSADRRRGTANLGVIHAGEATNVITPQATLRGEIRSHDAAFRVTILDAWRGAFEQAASTTVNDAGQPGQVVFDVRHDYEAFELNVDEPCVRFAARGVQALGAEPIMAVTDGGIDANWLNAHGVPTVSLGCGQQDIHTVDEALHVPSYLRACRLAIWLASTPMSVDGPSPA